MFESIFGKYLRWTNRNRTAFLLAAVFVFALSLYLASGLKLKSSLKELLPENSPSVVQLNKMLERVGGISVLTVAIESPNVEANKRFVDDLSARLEEFPKSEIRYVNAKVDNIRRFYEDNALHYIDKKDLEILYSRLKKLVDYEKFKRTPFFLDLGQTEAPLTLKYDDIKERNEKNFKTPLAVYDNYYGGEEGRFLIVMIRPQGAALAVDDARKLIFKVKSVVGELNPSSYDPDMRIGYCGNVVSTVEEYDTLKKDMVSTAGLCIFLVAAIIAVYFLRIRIVIFLGITLIVGIAVTFAITRYAIGYLNTQTAFLASIIIGTGINYGIILIGRYLEERKRGMEPLPAMEHALGQTMKPTFLAAATTAIAFLVLVAANVRGLSQFGFIGSIGVIACWIVSMLFLSAVVVISEDVLRLFRKLSSPSRRSAVFPALDKLLYHFPTAIIVFSVIIAGAASVLVWRYLPRSIEYDFTKLRNKVSAIEGTEALERRVSKLWQNSMTPAVVLLDNPEDGPEVCRAVKRQNELLPEEDRRVGKCYTIYDLLPDKQDEKEPVLKQIDNLLEEKWITEVKGDLGHRLRQMKNSLKKSRIEIADLPEDLIQNFKDLDGNVGTFAYINPRAGMLLSDGRNLIRFADTIKDIKIGGGRVLHATSEYLIFADIIKIVKKEAPLLTIVSFMAVSVFVLLSIRRMGESYVIIAALVWAVLAMVATMSLIGMRINFFNFIALPLTFGIGIDYALNVGMRMHKDKGRKTMDIIRHTGGAVILCSSTTIIGYYVLTKSYNQAVAQFGVMAIIGEFACIFAAIFLVPALVTIGRRIRDHKS
jgi:predicted RND superfamily exporter protein